MSLDDPQRLRDLVRYQRGELLREGLITKEEHADLLSNTPGAVKRLEGYDAMKARAEAAEANLETEAELRRSAFEGTRRAEAQCAAMRQALVEAFESTRAPTAQASTKQTASERDETYGLLCGARNRMLDALNASGAGAALLAERDRLREARDELLAVCEALVAGKQRDDVDDMAVGAIAKVKARAALGDG